MDQVLEFVLAVKAAHREINRRFSEALRPLGITVVQAEAILILSEAQPLSIKELGARILAEAGNPSRLVDRLVTADLVDRQEATEDRRQVQLTLTRRGHQQAERIRQARQPLLNWGRQLLDGQGLATATAVLHLVREQSPPPGAAG